MGRRDWLSTAVSSVAREAARRQRAAVQAQRAQMRAVKEMDSAERRRYAERRGSLADDSNDALAERLVELEGILLFTLDVDDTITFSSLKAPLDHPGRRPFQAPPHLLQVPPEPQEATYSVPAPTLLSKLIPGAERRLETRLVEAQTAFRRDHELWLRGAALRRRELEACRAAHGANRTAVQIHDGQVDEFEKSYLAGDADAVMAYAAMVLERSDYPDGFPQQFRLAYVPASRQLVVEYELPPVGIIPGVAEYKYVKSKDAVEEKPRKPTDLKERYIDLISSVTLRTVHELVESDRGNHIDVVSFSGFVNTIEKSTGQASRRCLISLSVSKDSFCNLDLKRVDRKVCLRNLGAHVSARPDAVQPVKPVVDFDMVDRRFVDQQDVLSTLELRPNLMLMNPFEFENLVGNLFSKMGLETKQTQSSRDGGVDVIAYDARPILGGKVVIQAKRYRHTVGVAAVRDLYGTMINEGASKGILVSTSGYGPAAFEFAKDKPIELIDGGGLLYLLENSGFRAQIVFPEEAGSE